MLSSTSGCISDQRMCTSTTDASGAKTTDEESSSIAKVNVKTPQSQITVTLRVVDIADVAAAAAVVDGNLLSFHSVPVRIEELMKEPFQSLVDTAEDSKIDTEEIVQARLALQGWFQNDLGYTGYKLRHIIPRSTRNKRAGTETRRRSFSIQKPVERFHTDSTHTAFTNIWLPISLTDYHLGFLYHPSFGLITASKLEQVCCCSSSNSNISTTSSQQRSFLQSCCIVYNPHLAYGQAIVFRSGGSQGVLHGSFRIRNNNSGNDNNNNNEGHRESVEFRCQKFTAGEWVYGEQRIASVDDRQN